MASITKSSGVVARESKEGRGDEKKGFQSEDQKGWTGRGEPFTESPLAEDEAREGVRRERPLRHVAAEVEDVGALGICGVELPHAFLQITAEGPGLLEKRTVAPQSRADQPLGDVLDERRRGERSQGAGQGRLPQLAVENLPADLLLESRAPVFSPRRQPLPGISVDRGPSRLPPSPLLPRDLMLRLNPRLDHPLVDLGAGRERLRSAGDQHAQRRNHHDGGHPEQGEDPEAGRGIPDQRRDEQSYQHEERRRPEPQQQAQSGAGQISSRGPEVTEAGSEKQAGQSSGEEWDREADPGGEEFTGQDLPTRN